VDFFIQPPETRPDRKDFLVRDRALVL